MFANNFAQPTPNTVPHNRAPERSRRDKSGAKTSGVVRLGNTKHDELAAINSAVLFYLLEFRGLNQAATLGKSKLLGRRTSCHVERSETSLTFPRAATRKKRKTIRDSSLRSE